MSRPGSDAVVLVTGFPSLYARSMARAVLAAEPRAFVYAIAPASGPGKAAAEAERDALEAEDRRRLVLLEGDASAMDLGLSGAEHRQLTREVDRIHHVAHRSSSTIDRKPAFAANVASTHEVLELARAAGSLDRVVLHSTALVAGDRTGVVYEEDLAAGQSFRSPAEETRMLAETMARRAMRELPIAVVRPTNLACNLETGATRDAREGGEEEPLDGLYLLLLILVASPADIALPFPGGGDVPLNIVPLDFIVRAAQAIGVAPLASVRSRTFHLADPNPLSARRVADLVTRHRFRGDAATSPASPGSGYVPSNLAKALLRTPGIDRFAKSPRAFVEQITTRVRYDTRNADTVLRASSVTCPPFESYVGELVRGVQLHLDARQKRRASTSGSAPESEVDDPLS